MKTNQIKQKNISKEKKTFDKMLKIYCKKKHKSKVFCHECLEIQKYVYERIERCPFILDKPFCAHCKVHCYQKQMREKVIEIMKFSGPKMIFRAPILSIKHVIGHIKYKRINK